MNKLQHQELVGFFEQIIANERELKIALRSIRTDKFSAEECFQMIAGDRSHISIPKFADELKSKGGLCTEDEIYELFGRFDLKRNGYITQQDFRHFFEAGKKQKTGSEHLRTASCRQKFRELLKSMLEGLRLVRIAARPLTKVPLYDVFNELDPQRIGYLSTEGLKKFMGKSYRPLTSKQAQLLLKGIKQGMVYRYATLEVLGEVVNPLELGYYDAYNEQLAMLVAEQQQQKEIAYHRQTQEQLALKARERSKQKADMRTREAAELVQKLNDDALEESRWREEIILNKQIRRKQLEEEKEIRRNIILEQKELVNYNAENATKSQQLYDLRQAELSESHLGYLLRKQAKINELELRQTRRKAQEFENELYMIKAETAKKRLELLNQHPLDSFQRYSFGVLHEKSPNENTNRMAQSCTYFRQPLERGHSFGKTYASPKANSIATNSTWLGTSGRSRIETIELELRKTELELEMRRNKVDLEDQITSCRGELTRLLLNSRSEQ